MQINREEISETKRYRNAFLLPWFLLLFATLFPFSFFIKPLS